LSAVRIRTHASYCVSSVHLICGWSDAGRGAVHFLLVVLRSAPLKPSARTAGIPPPGRPVVLPDMLSLVFSSLRTPFWEKSIGPERDANFYPYRPEGTVHKLRIRPIPIHPRVGGVWRPSRCYFRIQTAVTRAYNRDDGRQRIHEPICASTAPASKISLNLFLDYSRPSFALIGRNVHKARCKSASQICNLRGVGW